MKNNRILKAEEKTIYLKDKTSQKVTYLEIPPDITKASLRRDIKAGAVQFGEISALLEKKKQSSYIVISAEDLESGYMAVMYYAACIHTMMSADKDAESDRDFALP